MSGLGNEPRKAAIRSLSKAAAAADPDPVVAIRCPERPLLPKPAMRLSGSRSARTHDRLWVVLRQSALGSQRAIAEVDAAIIWRSLRAQLRS